MKINSIKLTNFRNYAYEKAYFSPLLNVLVGQNAQGKTNLIEAIYFCAVAKSPRASKENELIMWNNDRAKIELDFETNAGKKQIEIVINKVGKKNVRINQINILKIADLVGACKCVYFSPDELKLVKDAPNDRRKFLDTDISQLSKNYFYLLIKYNEILANRNKLLKESTNINLLKETLPIWSEQLADTGSKIIIRRLRFLAKLKLYAKEKHDVLTSNKENLEIEYSGLTGENENEIKEKFTKLLIESEDKDIKLGYTTIGPHRDDLKLIVNNIDIRSFGSQGQQRSVALSLKLAELEIFKEECGEYPILLLDDVLSELDDKRQSTLINMLTSVQTIITTTDLNEGFFESGNIMHIQNGKIETRNK